MANYLVNERFNLSFSGTYTDAEAEMDQIDFSSNALPGYDFDLSTVHEYSDLDIQQIDLSLGASYQVDDNVSLGLGFTYLRYDDDEPYLYDGTGEAYISSANVSFVF